MKKCKHCGKPLTYLIVTKEYFWNSLTWIRGWSQEESCEDIKCGYCNSSVREQILDSPSGELDDFDPEMDEEVDTI